LSVAQVLEVSRGALFIVAFVHSNRYHVVLDAVLVNVLEYHGNASRDFDKVEATLAQTELAVVFHHRLWSVGRAHDHLFKEVCNLV